MLLSTDVVYVMVMSFAFAANYDDLYQWSIQNYPEFWAEVWRFCGVVSSRKYEEVQSLSISEAEMHPCVVFRIQRVFS